MQGFASIEVNGRAIHLYGLLVVTHQMHFNSLLIAVIKSVMREILVIKVRIEQFIQAVKDVEIETGGYSLAVVVGGVEYALGLLQVDADEYAAITADPLA